MSCLGLRFQNSGGKMGATAVICLVLVVVVIFAIKGTVHRIRHGSSCCGERDVPEKNVRVADRNKSHYPFVYTADIGGMTCQNCARHLANALNSADGIWADVSLADKKARIRSKRILSATEVSGAVEGAGYRMLSFVESR